MSFKVIFFYPDRESPLVIVESTNFEYLFVLLKDGREEIPGKIFPKQLIHDVSKEVVDERYEWAIKLFREFGKKHYPEFFK